MGEFQSGGEELQSPEEKRREIIHKNVRELARRKEAQEIGESDFGPESIFYLQQEGKPLTRAEVGNRAVVLNQAELDGLGYIELVFDNGETTLIEAEYTGYGEDDLLIIFPEELGDAKE